MADNITYTDEEDLLTLTLDAQRNQLIVVTLLLTCASLALSVVAAVSGLAWHEPGDWGPGNTAHYFDWVGGSLVILASLFLVFSYLHVDKPLCECPAVRVIPWHVHVITLEGKTPKNSADMQCMPLLIS